MRIAIMQPYFMPYAGYFRLMAAADLFVMYDCVQFPRRGWVHRNKLMHKSGEMQWLTLPLTKGDRDETRIIDLEFPEGAEAEWAARMNEFPALRGDSPLLASVRALGDSPCDYIIRQLEETCARLDIKCAFARSSTLNLPASLHAQDRILAIAEHYKATTYINAPGGRELYQEDAFAARGIELKFLPDFTGKFGSILERLVTEPAADISQEIKNNL